MWPVEPAAVHICVVRRRGDVWVNGQRQPARRRTERVPGSTGRPIQCGVAFCLGQQARCSPNVKALTSAAAKILTLTADEELPILDLLSFSRCEANFENGVRNRSCEVVSGVIQKRPPIQCRDAASTGPGVKPRNPHPPISEFVFWGRRSQWLPLCRQPRMVPSL